MKNKLIALFATFAVATTGMVGVALPAAADSGGATYVAIGDSFAAGTGVPPYTAGDSAACLRSQTSSYPTLLSKWREFRGLDDVTCSGATTTTVEQQIGAAEIGPRTRSVTLTVGGNDIGWSQALAGCIGTPQVCSAAFAETAARVPGVTASIIGLIRSIVAKAPNADIYVTGYPYLFGDFRGTCDVGVSPAGTPIVVDRAIATNVNAIIFGLNAAIARGVVKSGERHVTYVSISAFSLSHGLCGSGTDWINGVLFSGGYPLPVSLHPNVAGEKAYAQRVLLASWLN